MAQFSQPLCTAVQLMLVNLLRSWGVQPSSVIGHSSGEIAAAYACDALTMDEAIICAYLRGRVMVQPSKRAGAMAAVGLGVSAVEPYLRDRVVIACENSPSSTTISGDADQVDLVLESLAQEKPETFTRRLLVDRAYHSGKNAPSLLYPLSTVHSPITKISTLITWFHRSHERARPEV